MSRTDVPMPASLPMLACLPMYDWPEVQAETAAHWDRVRAGALAHTPGIDLPDTLITPEWEAVAALWHDPALVFSQTCWGPLSLGLIDRLLPLAQPDYTGIAGGRDRFYRSALIARDGTADPVPATPSASLPEAGLKGRVFAFNAYDSLSGYIGLAQDLGVDPCAQALGCVETGGHRASVRAVAEGRADLAAIDCRSWALAQRYEPCARRLTVIGWTSERLGLPYVTSRATDPRTAQALRQSLISMGCHPAPEGRDE